MVAIQDFILIVGGVIVAITVHECAHAWSAYLLGDPTARLMGRVTLNPLKHLDPTGTMMIILSSISGFGIGWGKPTPVNPYRLKYGSMTGMALVSLAGPLSNMLLALILMLPFRLGLQAPYAVAKVVVTMAWVNVVLAVFNLIPLPPLDGFKVLVGLLGTIRSESMRAVNRVLAKIESMGFMLLFAVLAVGWITGFSLLGLIMREPINLLWTLIAGR
jgi:Zn-dependent protease